MNVKNIKLVIIFSIFVSFFNYTFGEDANDIIKKVQKIYKSAKDVVIDFDRVFIWKLSKNPDTIKGRIYLMGDDYIKYETKEQIFVTDGKYVWSYSSATNQTIIDIYKSDEDEALPKEVIFNFDKKYNSKFVGMENIGGIDCYVLQGTPKNENLEIKSIKLWIDSKKWVAKKIEYINLNDNVIIYNIENVKFNNELKNTFFKFEPPKNSEIIDLRIQQY